MSLGKGRRAPGRKMVLPGTDAGTTAATGRIGNWALAGLVLLLSVLIVLLDVVTGEDLRVVPLLVVVPALASVFCSLRQTVWVAVWITVVVVGSGLGGDGTFWDFVFGIGFTVLACALGVAACAARIRHATEMDRLRFAAVALQRQILRPLPVITDQVFAYGLYEPIEEDRFVGGDIYEVVQSPYGTRVIIGDVQGKGIAAIGAGFAAIAAFREAAVREPTLTGVVEALEAAVVRHNAFSAQTGEAERFVTALVLGFDEEDRVQAVNCGHLPPRLLHEGRASAVPLERTYVPLGLAGLSRETRTAESFALPPGATLLVVTDGVTEARDAARAFYPLDRRLADWAGHGPRELLDALHVDLETFTGGIRRDDVAVLALGRTPGGSTPRPTAAAEAVRPVAGAVSD
ncbi:PP2C family protein-serine/threonine phosphatase [Streptomyces cyaneofuscatus]|uniref:Serine/threonine-protein phosphatase n=1 Tax=Streptomyces cyaneofuscatus TaxID=66883 RepID=A0ABZ1EPM3_9ACTN|nr:SpoIIE family protein phosphatase [Streptomyces cyaneofuscatus]WSB06021.1 serine/threonine-protein phosphatase [Streptomyces cyaneofuscatus]WSD50443.1 serine/threonine-protein phosphatase [Streptomyces cyaneofuscatus]WTA93937.1 serine/threonine-protein phosphatase [Streptomyces cyaneofuscatus]